MPTQTHLYILDQGASDDSSKTPGRIFTCLSDGTSGRDLVTNLSAHPDGIAITPSHSYIFWTNMGHPSSFGWTNSGSIQRCDLDGSNVITIIPPGTNTHTPKQLVIAEKAKKLYWCDREGMKVMRCDLEGGDVEVLVSNGDAGNKQHRDDALRWCVGISVDEQEGWVYWTQKGATKGGKGRILRCPVNGGAGPNRENIELLFDNLPEPIDLSLDLNEGWLYWTDRGDINHDGNSVNRARIPKTGQSTAAQTHDVLIRNLHEGIGLHLDTRNNAMYITDLSGRVYTANMDGSDEITLVSNLGLLTGIAIAHLD